MRARYPVHVFLIDLRTLKLIAGKEETLYQLSISVYTVVSSLLLSACLGSKHCAHHKYNLLIF